MTTDPKDTAAWRVDDSTDGATELVGWDGGHVLVTAERADGRGESRRVDPSTSEVTVIDRRAEGRLIDSWAGVSLVRIGPRGARSLRLLWAGEDTALLPDDPGSVSDEAVLLDDHHARRMTSHHALGRRLPPHTEADGTGREGYVRALVRSDVEAERARLLQVAVTDCGASYRVLAERDDAELDTFAVSQDESRAVLVWNLHGGLSKVQILELADATLHDPIPMRPAVASEPSLSGDGRLLAITLQSPQRERTVELLDPSTLFWADGPYRYGRRRGVGRRRGRSRPPRGGLQPELQHFTARDGLGLSGWWYPASHPVLATNQGASAGEAKVYRGPVVIHLHGGPEGQERPGFSHLFPVLLEAGLSVFAPHVRGSGGFGRAFSHADDVELRRGSIDNVADAAAWLVEAARRPGAHCRGGLELRRVPHDGDAGLSSGSRGLRGWR